MEKEELIELRDEFSQIDLTDDEQVRDWFRKPYLTFFDRCTITQKSTWWVSKLRKKVGLNPIYITESNDGVIKEDAIMHSPKMRDRSSRNRKYQDKEWIKEYYLNKQLTTRQCAKLAGISDPTMARWINKHIYDI